MVIWSSGHYSHSSISKLEDGSIQSSGSNACNVDVDDGSYDMNYWSNIIAPSFNEWVKKYMHSKIIFLDIDGVLNVHYPEHDDYGRLFHPQFVENLKRIIDETSAEIVISSSWKHSGLDNMKDMWIDRRLPGKVIDITPTLKRNKGDEYLTFSERKERGNEIQNWLDKNPTVSYVIIDDDNDMLEDQMEFFVQTSENFDHSDYEDAGYGLTTECTNDVIKILNI